PVRVVARVIVRDCVDDCVYRRVAPAFLFVAVRETTLVFGCSVDAFVIGTVRFATRCAVVVVVFAVEVFLAVVRFVVVRAVVVLGVMVRFVVVVVCGCTTRRAVAAFVAVISTKATAINNTAAIIRLRIVRF
ncbi:MAG: hypothetical protein J6W40_05185, partial [Alphaproteobacteria bacterium]|nr:hypothetical protein [Alphaproteobacteria bacterium]